MAGLRRRPVDQSGSDDIVNPMRGRTVDVGAVIDRECDVVLEISAIGHVVIDEEVGQPLVKHLHEGAGFGRVGLEVVAIEIEVGSVGAPAHLFRAILIDAVVRRPALVSIGVVHRDENEDSVVEQRGLRF